MIVPQYWAEARLRERVNGRQVTVRRFGWSDESESAAQRHAADRAAEALARIRAGEAVPRRERKVVYGGGAGLPIREEIVGRAGTAVLTRNAYGAVCLNVPDVLFADVDVGYSPAPPILSSCLMMLLIPGAGLAALTGNWPLTRVLIGVALAVVAVRVAFHWWRQRGGRMDRLARAHIERFAERHPDWALRVYRTPAGYRVLVLHRLFDPLDPEVADCFRELRVDPVYARMCAAQRCFRARVSPKPWRVGVTDHIRPRPGVWPVAERWRPARAAWVARYEEASRGFAACRFEFAAGQGPVHPTADAVRRLHDDLCRTESDLPLG